MFNSSSSRRPRVLKCLLILLQTASCRARWVVRGMALFLSLQSNLHTELRSCLPRPLTISVSGRNTVITLSYPAARTCTCKQRPTAVSLPMPLNALKPCNAFLHLAAFAIVSVSFAATACISVLSPSPLSFRLMTCPLSTEAVSESKSDDLFIQQTVEEDHVFQTGDAAGDLKEKELKDAFEQRKSKTYALTVPLRVVALHGSVPPSWLKEFIQVQGRRMKLQLEFRGTLADIFSELSLAAERCYIEPKSAISADIVTVGDSWLSLAVRRAIIEPMDDADEQDWYKGLSDKWKVYLRRNHKGDLDSDGKIWGAPYRWGSMVIAYKRNKFRTHKLAPVEDWADLFRPELCGKIAMVSCPREVVGAILKYLGASYNTKDINKEVPGGRDCILRTMVRFQRQVKLFDSASYLKAFGLEDIWVAIGWSSDVLPVAKRMTNVTVVVPRSGASLWADLWAVPAVTGFTTDRIGGRVRGPSPLIMQWIEFCLQTARSSSFFQEVTPGASPSIFDVPVAKSHLETNLIAGVPPPEVLARCEFLEPLSEGALTDYKWLIATMQRASHGSLRRLEDYLLKYICKLVHKHAKWVPGAASFCSNKTGALK